MVAGSTWYDETKHGPGFRNVMTYGAKGDGVTDDSAAIYKALTDGVRACFVRLARPLPLLRCPQR